MLTIPDIAALGIDKAAVLATARDVMPGLTSPNPDPALRARLSAVCAYALHVKAAVAKLIEARLIDAYAGHELINEPRDEVDDIAHAVWDETLGFAVEKELSAVRDKIGPDVFEEIAGSDVGYHEVGRLADIAGEIATRLTPHLANPAEEQTGKWLSKVGIVKADLAPLVELAKTNPPLTTTPSDDEDEDEAEAAHANGAAPSPADVLKAIVLWAEGSGPNLQEFSGKMKVSAQTLRNWSIGRMPRSGVKPEQIEVLTQDCEECIGKLQQALTVFRAAQHAPPP